MSDIAVIIGLGYVGLPLAREATRSGLKVIGLDLNDEIVAGLEAGRSHIDDLTDDDVIEMRRGGFRATTDSRVIAQAGAVVICVPTPLAEGGSPDLSAVIAAAQSIAAQLQPGTLVSLESTTYPGTTDELVRPILESTGLVAGVDFNLAFSPERIDPGNEHFGPRNTPKVVGGHTENCTQAAADFYGKFVDTVVKTRGTREAEMAKLLENTYRHINIALVNEMARFCHDLDIDLWDVIGCSVDQAVRIPIISAWTWCRWTLHSHRPELSISQCASEAGLLVPLRRAGPGNQQLHAGVRGSPCTGFAEPAKQGGSRSLGVVARSNL